MDKRSKQLIGIDWGNFEAAKRNVLKLCDETGCEFTHIFLTHTGSSHSDGIDKWTTQLPELTIVNGKRKFGTNSKVVEGGEIISIGDLSVFCMPTPGHT